MGDTEVLKSCSRFDKTTGKVCGKLIDGKGTWCKACRSAYQREYVEKQSELERSQGYAAGARAMREGLMEWFGRVPHGMFSGIDVASNIHNFRLPNMPPTTNGKTAVAVEATPVPA